MNCPKCHAPMSEGEKDMICWNGGNILEKTGTEGTGMNSKNNNGQSTSNGSKKLRNILIIIIIFVIAAVGGSIIYLNSDAYYYRKGMQQYNDKNYYSAFFTLLKIFEGDRPSRDKILKNRSYYETIFMITENCYDEMDDIPEDYFDNNHAVHNARYIVEILDSDEYDYDYDEYAEYDRETD